MRSLERNPTPDFSQTGTFIYIGIPKSGKTSLALDHFRDAISSNGAPGIIIDSERVSNFARLNLPRAKDLWNVLEIVFAQRKSCIWSPGSRNEFNALCEAILEARIPVILLVDEFTNFISATNREDDPPLIRMARSWRHIPIYVFLTSQHLTGDVPSAVFSCAPRIYLFRSTALPVLKRLEEHYQLDRTRVRTLDQFEYLELYEGF